MTTSQLRLTLAPMKPRYVTRARGLKLFAKMRAALELCKKVLALNGNSVQK